MEVLIVPSVVVKVFFPSRYSLPTALKSLLTWYTIVRHRLGSARFGVKRWSNYRGMPLVGERAEGNWVLRAVGPPANCKGSLPVADPWLLDFIVRWPPLADISPLITTPGKITVMWVILACGCCEPRTVESQIAKSAVQLHCEWDLLNVKALTQEGPTPTDKYPISIIDSLLQSYSDISI